MKLTTMVRKNVCWLPPDCARWAVCAALCLFVGAASALAQEEAPGPAPSAEEQWVPRGEEELASLAAAASPEERAALLASGDTAALEAALDAANHRLEQLAESIPVIHRDMREFRRKAMTESDKAKEIRAKIQALEDELSAWADEQPEIRERREALESVRGNMADELRLRRQLARKLGRDTFRAAPAEQPPLEP